MARNLADATGLIREAAGRSATYVQTPEVSNLFEPDKERNKAICQTEATDLSVRAYSDLAKDLNIHLHAGSFALRGETGKLVNRSLLFGPDGKIVARYDKIHLFDIDLASGESYRESATFDPGQFAVTATLPFAKFGLAICYDVRFPLLFNALAKAGVNILTIPAAFTVPTGEAHWHVLQRARAIETGSFVLSAAQGGTHECGRSTFGHSIAVSPWGEILAEAGTDPCVTMVEIDPQQSATARARIPALANARPFTLKSF